MAEQKLIELIERYLNGELSEDELIRFELLRMENADVNNRVEEHQQFTGLIKQYGERLELEKRLNEIHDEIDVHTLKEELMIHPSWIINLWRHHHSKISVAASIFIFAVLCTLLFTGYLNNRNSEFVELKGFIKTQIKSELRGSHNGAKPVVRPTTNPGNFRGSGFAISSNGYIATNYHVINNADSVYVENVNGKSFKAKVFYTDPISDIAILQVTDTAFVNLGSLPYTIKKSESDIGENVYTLGYPRDAIVFGTGFLTANTGLTNNELIDSTTYQVSLPVNPGNSGGPLIDSRGNLIGIIKAKETRIEGAHFAIKSNYLLKAIQEIPSDSLKKPLNFYSKNALAGLNKVQQVKKLQNFVFMVKVYKN